MHVPSVASDCSVSQCYRSPDVAGALAPCLVVVNGPHAKATLQRMGNGTNSARHTMLTIRCFLNSLSCAANVSGGGQRS